MCDTAELFPDGLVQCWMPMSMDRHPQRRNTVDIFLPFIIVQVYAFTFCDDQRFFFAPALHLGERVPEIFLVFFGERERGHGEVFYHMRLYVQGERDIPEKARKSLSAGPRDER